MISRILLSLLIISLAACGGGGEEGEGGFYPQPYLLQNSNQMCLEYTPYTQNEQNQLQAQGWYPGNCSQSNSLGTCEYSYEGNGFYVSSIYYQDETGLLTTDLIRQSCEMAQGRFIEGSIDTSNDVTRTYIMQGNSLSCLEYIGDTQASHNLIESSGGVEGLCSREQALGVCEKPDNGIGFRSKTVYYPGDTGLMTAEDFVGGCENIGGTFIYGSDGVEPEPEPTPDVAAPVLSEVTGIGSTIDLSPSYEFNSTESGQITWMQGSCTSEISSVVEGNNLIELSALTSGEYFNCEFTVTDNAGNQSGPLILSSFTIITPDNDYDGFADFVEVEYGTDPLDAASSPMAILANAVDFSDDNDSDGFSDELEAWYYTDPNHAGSKPVDENNDLIPDDFDSSNDSDAPILLGFDIYESGVNVQTGTETVTFNLTIIDDISGVKYVSVRLSSAEGQEVNVDMGSASLGGLTHTVSMESSEFGEFASAGIWSISYVAVRDIAGNYSYFYGSDLEELGFETSINVVNANSDTSAPELSAFSIVEDEINILNGTETVTFNLTIIDDISGVKYVSVRLSSAEGQEVNVDMGSASLGGLTHTVSMESSEFGEFASAGIWSISYVAVRDIAGNYSYFYSSDLEELGFEMSINVNN
jgi:hypothetical protein